MNMSKKSVFFSFHFDNDFWRTMQIRNIGSIEKNEPISANDWESVQRKGDNAIQNWIDENLNYKHCTIVLIGSETYKRPWVLYEIEKSWQMGKGLIGIYIHKLKDQNGKQDSKGKNPFEYVNINLPNSYSDISSVIKTHDSFLSESKDVYNVISDNIERWVEDAINQRKLYKMFGI